MISRDTILAKTHYGTGIYSYILRQFYPGETVMKISGRDCGICRNPYAGGATTLHIWHEKIYPDQKLSPEIARHKDQFDAIPPGDCFDFAQLYWKKVGQELLISINEDLHLHLEDGYCPYGPKDIQTAATLDAIRTLDDIDPIAAITAEIERAFPQDLDVSIPSKSSKPAVPSGAISEGNTHTIPSAIPAEGMEGTEETEGPTITDTLPYPLPDFLQKVVTRKKSTEDADLLLLGALAVISACLPGISGEYDELVFYPNFFLFVTGNASAGKGRLSLCRAIAEPIHEALREQNEAENADYEKQLAAYNASKNKQNLDKPKAPPLRILFIPANSSATAFYQTLSENDEKGLMFETEGDTLANTFAADHGHYSEGFRQAFQHESISYTRRKDREYVNVKRPRLSAVLSGTPRQIQNLITDTENGLFSRFVFYRLPTCITWHNVFAKSGDGSINEYFASLGAEFFDFYTELKNAPDIVFTFKEEQQDKFNAVFEELQYDTVLRCNVDIVSSVRRLGLVTFRIAMIFSALRMMEDGVLEEALTCRADDYENALHIARILLEHIIGVYNTLPHVSTPVKAPADARTFSKQKFWSDLPPQFDTQTFLQAASALAIAPKTAEKYITAWCKGGQLVRVAQGHYSKTV